MVLKLPVIVAPMFLVSTPTFVIESCKAGIVGTFPLLNARPIEQCEEWLQEIQDACAGNEWGVNYIANPKTNKRYEDELNLIAKYQPPIVITSLGHPGAVLDVVHSYGGRVFADVISKKHALKCAESGVDGLILVCAGAGGHGGNLNPFAFLHEVKSFFDGTIILAGGISSGQDILAAQIMGADFAYMGTRFLAAAETNSSDAYREMLIEASSEDILYTNSFSGVYANMLVPSLVQNGIDPNALEVRKDLNLSHVLDVKAWRDVWSAGQGVYNIQKVESVHDIVRTLQLQYESALSKYQTIT